MTYSLTDLHLPQLVTRESFLERYIRSLQRISLATQFANGDNWSELILIPRTNQLIHLNAA